MFILTIKSINFWKVFCEYYLKNSFNIRRYKSCTIANNHLCPHNRYDIDFAYRPPRFWQEFNVTRWNRASGTRLSVWDFLEEETKSKCERFQPGEIRGAISRLPSLRLKKFIPEKFLRVKCTNITVESKSTKYLSKIWNISYVLQLSINILHYILYIN